MENTTQPNNKVYIYLLAAFFALFIGSGIFLLTSNKSNQKQESATTSTVQQEKMVIPTSMPTKGSFNLTTEKPEIKVDDNAVLTVIADSAGENISAYDVILRYDPLVFDFVEAKSLDREFQVYSYKKDNRLSLTVVKTGQDPTPSIFVDKPVVNLVFKAKRIGDQTVSILASFEKESTKFVNEKTEVVYPAVNDVNLMVK